MLLARRRELVRISSALAGATAGEGSALVVRGDVGTGKSAVLEAGLDQGPAMPVIRLEGIAVESGVPYAGLERLICSMRVPPTDGQPGDLIPTPAATSSWMSYVAVARGLREIMAHQVEAAGRLALVVDDAQWLDNETLGMLGSLARRLGDMPVAVLIAVRGDAARTELAGIEEIRLGDLAGRYLEELIDAAAGPLPVAPGVAETVARASGGNPLAVLEMVSALSPEQLSGSGVLPDPLRLGRRLTDAYRHELEELDPRCRQAVLVVASTGGETALVPPALRRLGLQTSDLAPAEDAGLLRLTPAGAELRHPVARAGIFSAASADERRRVLDLAAEIRGMRSPEGPVVPGPSATLVPPEEEADDADACAGDYVVQLLGGFSVHRASVDVTPRQAQPAQAVKIVALRGGMAVDELVEALWPGAAPGVGRVRLRNVLSRVRDTCADLMVRDADMVRLAPGVAVDVRRFEEEAASALAAVEGGQLAAVERANFALALYTGELLPTDRYSSWASADRERLAHRQRELLEVLVDEAERADDVVNGVRLVEQAISLQPYDESLYVMAARLMGRRGWRSKALEMLRRADAIARELGVPPSRTARELKAQLRGA